MSRDARSALRAADAMFQATPLPPEVIARMRRRTLSEGSGAWRWWVPLAAAVAALLFFVLRPGPAVEDIELAATQRYAHGGVDIVASAMSSLHRDHSEYMLRTGAIDVAVEKRKAGEPPVRIAVSHGAIEVVGTRFTVHQRTDGGDVTLHEGVIRFMWASGAVRELRAGDSLVWPEPQLGTRVVPPEPDPPEPAPVQKPPRHALKKEPAVIHETDAAWLLEEVAVARSRGEYVEAVRLLDKGLAGIVSAATRERFSFELGSILTHQVADPARACRQWGAHRAAFPKGRYAREVQSAMEKAGCDAR